MVQQYLSIKQMGDQIKVVSYRPVRPSNGLNLYRENGEKLACNLYRARGAVQGLALCNPWEYFVTLTLDGAKYNRYDLGRYKADLSQWVRNQRRKLGAPLAYLLVPEEHQDGAWHIHGLLFGVPKDELQAFVRGLHPQNLVEGGFLNWLAYQEKFGFCSLAPVRDHRRVATYISKYVTKSMTSRDAGGPELGKHLYLCSRGLQRPVTLFSGHAVVNRPVEGWTGDFCSVEWFPAGSVEIDTCTKTARINLPDVGNPLLSSPKTRERFSAY